MMHARLADMVARHVDWQLAHLGNQSASLHEQIVNGFIEPVREAARRNAETLARLSARGLRLGVVSNGCGNVDRAV